MAKDSTAMELTDYSLTKRIVFLIDLDPLLHQQNPKSFLNCILSSAKLLLSFPPLSSSLFTFKLFFSSLSPILSSSKLRNLPLNLSFDDPDSTLRSLCETLESVTKLIFSGPSGPAQATNVATSMRQLLHDYSWDLFMDDDIPLGTPLMRHNLLKPNLVVMFSPIYRSKKWVSQFMDSETDESLFTSTNLFCSKFSSLFRSVSDAFLSKAIHFSWIDVKYDRDNDNLENGTDESANVGCFETAIRHLGWGFCSMQSIISGSMLLPFGLIYPSIGISSKVFDFNTHGKRIRTHLGLEISDANGKPLECKCCELELIDLKNLAPDIDSGLLLSAEPNNRNLEDHEKNPFVESCMDGMLKVEALQKHDKFAKLVHRFSEPFIVREFTEKSSSGSQSEFFANKVIEVLASEMGEVVRKCPPTWQIFLGFMYREGYSALVSLSNGNTDKVLGILKPYTSTFALVSLAKEKSCPVNWLKSIERVEPQQEKTGDDPDGYVKKKKTRKNLVKLKDLSWSAFQKGKYEDLNIELEELYFAREADKSKKLLFVKYWLKQMKNVEYRLENLYQVSEQPPSVSASFGENSTTADLIVKNEVVIDKGLENSPDVLGEIPNKIRLGVESEGVDLVALAERLVKSCIHCLASESRSFSDEGSDSKVITELIHLLLRDPKDLEEKNKDADQTEDSYTVREYELQIFFRMEIMRSELSCCKASVKQRFVKQICLLLESIQCRLEAFFGEWNLHDYVEKTIKSRYCEDLEGVVHQIYSKMDLLFDDEDELPNSLLNSEENSDQRHDKKEKCDKQMYPRERGEYMQRLTEAQDKRERARRFASLTTWQPDLQRVWASKNAKSAVKAKPDPSRKTSRKRHRHDVVCETPMTQNKRSGSKWSPDQGSGGKCSSISKALFSDRSN